MNFLALATSPSVSNDKSASVSVETRPGTIFKISTPNNTNRSSWMRRTNASPPAAFLFSATALSRSHWYSGFWAALRMREGLVVASRGPYCRMASKSPVSATTTVNCLSWSNWLNAEAGRDDAVTVEFIIFAMRKNLFQLVPSKYADADDWQTNL